MAGDLFSIVASLYRELMGSVLFGNQLWFRSPFRSTELISFLIFMYQCSVSGTYHYNDIIFFYQCFLPWSGWSAFVYGGNFAISCFTSFARATSSDWDCSLDRACTVDQDRVFSGRCSLVSRFRIRSVSEPRQLSLIYDGLLVNRVFLNRGICLRFMMAY